MQQNNIGIASNETILMIPYGTTISGSVQKPRRHRYFPFAYVCFYVWARNCSSNSQNVILPRTLSPRTVNVSLTEEKLQEGEAGWERMRLEVSPRIVPVEHGRFRLDYND